MKDKLIEELDSADLFLRNRTNSSPAPLNEYDILEMLNIANICDEAARVLEKAIIPPCKIGDTIYRISPYWSHIHSYEVVGFHLGEFPTLNSHKRKPYLVCYNKTTRDLKHIPIEDIGILAFFSREEAEQALKGDDK